MLLIGTEKAFWENRESWRGDSTSEKPTIAKVYCWILTIHGLLMDYSWTSKQKEYAVDAGGCSIIKIKQSKESSIDKNH